MTPNSVSIQNGISKSIHVYISKFRFDYHYRCLQLAQSVEVATIRFLSSVFSPVLICNFFILSDIKMVALRSYAPINVKRGGGGRAIIGDLNFKQNFLSNIQAIILVQISPPTVRIKPLRINRVIC